MKSKNIFLAVFTFVCYGHFFSLGGGGIHTGKTIFGITYGGSKYSPWSSVDYLLFYSVVVAFIAFIFLVFFGNRIVKRNRKIRINNLLSSSEKEDELWNREELMKFIDSAFRDMQNAWTNRDMDLVKGLVTSDFLNQSQELLNGQISSGFYDFIDEIDVQKIEIIGIADHKEDAKDKFVAYIIGKKVDVVLYDDEVKNANYPKRKFQDLYHFVRQGRSWKLNNITNDIDTASIRELDFFKER